MLDPTIIRYNFPFLSDIQQRTLRGSESAYTWWKSLHQSYWDWRNYLRDGKFQWLISLVALLLLLNLCLCFFCAFPWQHCLLTPFMDSERKQIPLVHFAGTLHMRLFLFRLKEPLVHGIFVIGLPRDPWTTLAALNFLPVRFKSSHSLWFELRRYVTY